MANMTPEMNLMWGLGEIVDLAKGIPKILYVQGCGAYAPTNLPQHPFGLEIPARDGTWDHIRRWKGIGFMGHPYYTERSVHTFGAYVLEALTSAPVDCVIHYLRVILARASGEDRHQHKVYFEIMIGNEIMMCGGCNDYSGAGSCGKEELERMFKVLSTLSGIPIQEVETPYLQSEQVEREIRIACDRTARLMEA